MPLVLFLTLVEAAFGMALVQSFIPRSALGPGFGKTISALIFFCLLPAVLLARGMLPPGGAGLLGAVQSAGAAALFFWFCFFVVLNYPKDRALLMLSAFATLAQGAMIVFIALHLARYYATPASQDGYGPSPASLGLALTAGISTSGFLLGAVTMAMMIGHWYLVIPGLSIGWLKGGCLAFAAAIALRLISIAISIMVGAWSDPFGAQDFFDRFYTETSMLFVLRLFVGIAIPSAFCGMAYRAAVIRSTQSSTGILFPAMIVVFLGEMLATFLIIGLRGLCV